MVPQVTWTDPEGLGVQPPPPPQKNPSGNMFPWNYWYGPPSPFREAIGPIVSNCFSSEVRTALRKIC